MNARVSRAALGVFITYAIILAIATHWPRLRIEGPIERPDLWIHMGAFGLWAALLALTALLGPRWTVSNILASVGVALAYAAIDEGSQAIPALGRTAALDDYLADAAGILAAGAGLCLIAWRVGRAGGPRADTTSQT